MNVHPQATWAVEGKLQVGSSAKKQAKNAKKRDKVKPRTPTPPPIKSYAVAVQLGSALGSTILVAALVAARSGVLTSGSVRLAAAPALALLFAAMLVWRASARSHASTVPNA